MIALGAYPAKFGSHIDATPSCTNDYLIVVNNAAGGTASAGTVASATGHFTGEVARYLDWDSVHARGYFLEDNCYIPRSSCNGTYSNYTQSSDTTTEASGFCSPHSTPIAPRASAITRPPQTAPRSRLLPKRWELPITSRKVLLLSTSFGIPMWRGPMPRASAEHC